MNNPGAVKGLAGVYNSGNLTAALTTRNTWYTFSGTVVSSVLVGFTLVANVLTCVKPGWYTFSGDATFSADKTCNINYGLFVNGNVAPSPGLDTPRDILAMTKQTTFGANQPVYLNYGDSVTVKVEATDEDAVALTCQNINLTLREA